MANIALQIKSSISLVLATGAGICFAIASRRFDASSGHWKITGGAGVALLLFQLILIFVPSKEEAELARFQRKEEMEQDLRSQQEKQHIELAVALSLRVQKEIESGNLESAEKWIAFGRNLHEK